MESKEDAVQRFVIAGEMGRGNRGWLHRTGVSLGGDSLYLRKEQFALVDVQIERFQGEIKYAPLIPGLP